MLLYSRVLHVLADGHIIDTAATLEKRLMAQYTAVLQQPTLFDKPQTRAEAPDHCSERRNRAIGHSLPGAGSPQPE